MKRFDEIICGKKYSYNFKIDPVPASHPKAEDGYVVYEPKIIRIETDEKIVRRSFKIPDDEKSLMVLRDYVDDLKKEARNNLTE